MIRGALLACLLVACTTPVTAVTPSPSAPTATASVAVSAPSPPPGSPPAPAELRSDFGLIANLRDGASQPVLRTERDATPLATFTGGVFRQVNGAVSVDGRKIA